jgi:hypothetical protein
VVSMTLGFSLLSLRNKANSTGCCKDHYGRGRDLDVGETNASPNPKSQDFFGFFSVDAFDSKRVACRSGEEDVQSVIMVLEAAD